jgi:DNA-directed RNA polymerase specialized sigma24 family protein
LETNVAVWPTTDPSLIRRLGDTTNHDAWRRFDSLYRPIVYRFARRWGADHHHAEEVAADVMRRVARAAVRWSKHRPPERFAAWLTRVARNSLLNLVCRELSKQGRGGTTHQQTLLERPAANEVSRRWWDEDWKRELVRLAAARIRDDFDDDSWSAFWQTHVTSPLFGSFGRAIDSVVQKHRHFLDRIPLSGVL